MIVNICICIIYTCLLTSGFTAIYDIYGYYAHGLFVGTKHQTHINYGDYIVILMTIIIGIYVDLRSDTISMKLESLIQYPVQ